MEHNTDIAKHRDYLQSRRCANKEFLKIDFPKVPYPKTLSKFRTLTKLDGELRQLHLLESPTVERYITPLA